MTRFLRGSIGVAVALVTAAAAGAQPPRDAQRSAPSGTASIAGVVLSEAAQPRPLRRARVSLTGSTLPIGRTVITSDTGAFRFERLAAGSYSIVAVKDAYVTVAHGTTRPNRPGSPIVLKDGETRQVTLRMPRGGVITGTVTGPDGQPMSGIGVMAMVSRYNPGIGERRLSPASASAGPFGVALGANSVTDDRGVYRLFGLAPGDYVVVASIRSPLSPTGFRTLSDAEIRRALAEVREPAPHVQPGTAAASRPPPSAEPQRRATYSPVFFPGTTIAGQATTITLAAGEERAGTDIPIQYVPMARVEGVAVSQAGGAQPVNVRLISNQPGSDMAGRQGAMANADGAFVFQAVPPGPYLVVAQSMSRPTAPGAAPAIFTASTEIIVSGEDIGNVMLTLQPGVTLSGRLAFQGSEPPAVDFPSLRIPVPLTLKAVGMPAVLRPLQLDAAGRFTINDVATGAFHIGSTVQGVRTPIGKWWIKSISMDGREMLDRPIEIRQGSENVVITLSSQASTLSGTARRTEGSPASGVFVVVFSADSGSWFANSRRVAGVRAGADGTYSIRNLPPGEYFALATYDVDPGEWFDPQLLQRLAATAQRVTLAQDEQKTHDLLVR